MSPSQSRLRESGLEPTHQPRAGFSGADPGRREALRATSSTQAGDGGAMAGQGAGEGLGLLGVSFSYAKGRKGGMGEENETDPTSFSEM